MLDHQILSKCSGFRWHVSLAEFKSKATMNQWWVAAPMSREHKSKTESNLEKNGGAHLVVREGSKWKEVFTLSPGQVTTVGRAPTNRIVLHDEICSRNHCEVFQSGDHWTLRDLGSRNGTLVDGIDVEGDWDLEDGQLIQIGSCEISFTYDPSQMFLDDDEEEGDLLELTETVDGLVSSESSGSDSEPEITHRKRKTRYDLTSTAELFVGRDRISQELAQLYRLGLAMGSATDSKQLSKEVLEGLFMATGANIGAILLLPKGMKSNPQPRQLRIHAYKCLGEEFPYETVSNYLSGIVLDELDAVLAHDVADDSRLAGRDSLGEIHAKSVICAPIRVGPVIYGLIHLYSTDPAHLLEPDDLEFTLAVADRFGWGLENLEEKESLATSLTRVKHENQTLRQQLSMESELVGDSPALKELRKTISQIAPTDATVLIRGESGVGKELIARAIHFGSERRSGPFICLNCAALSESLLESELFGHEKGSFTGATERKTGKFEGAHGGTLFLDEVGEMSIGIQAKFLRVLEGHPFERVGGGTPINVDVRVIAATNRELEKAVQEKKFRKDLFFRLFVCDVTVTPLREHPTDIAILANYFLERFARKMNRAVTGFTEGAMSALMSYDWPGNVRELQNTVERTVILCSGELAKASDIQLSTLGSTSRPGASIGDVTGGRDVSLDSVEQEHIVSVLNRNNWNKSKAAQILGIERSTLDRKLKRYRVVRPKN